MVFGMAFHGLIEKLPYPTLYTPRKLKLLVFRRLDFFAQTFLKGE